MFLTLLLATFAIALVVSLVVTRLFDASVGKILNRIIDDEIASAWQRFIRFALIVVGISGGVRIYALERYIQPDRITSGEEMLPPPELTAERWSLEVYRTIIETLQSLAWALLLFFLFALIAYVIVRWREARHGTTEAQKADG